MSEADTLLAEIIFQIDEVDEERRVEIENVEAREQELIQSGNSIREMEVSRSGSVEQEIEEEGNANGGEYSVSIFTGFSGHKRKCSLKEKD